MATSQNLDLKKLIPLTLRNELLDGLMSNTFNQFVSQEDSVLINGRIGAPVEGDASIQASSLDRDINALIPALTTKIGTESNAYTFPDIVSKLKAIGVNTDDMNRWMAERSFNYTLPINYDKFINYANYYWIGGGLTTKPNLSWNPDVTEEYYVIAKPSLTDAVKMPVDLVATSNLALYANNRAPETFTVTFTSTVNYSILSSAGISQSGTIASGNGVSTTVVVNTSSAPLMSFKLTNGSVPFSAGDVFTIQITYFSSNILVSLVSVDYSGKGTLDSVQTLSPLMLIDGIQLTGGERVLVTGQTVQSENGIYDVQIGSKWTRTYDANSSAMLAVGSKVFVKSGSNFSGHTFEVTSSVPSTTDFGASVAFSDIGNSSPKPINEWQEYNLWVHKDDFDNVKSLGATLDNSVQASRPIVEYNSGLEMNTSVDSDNFPTAGNIGNAIQTKWKLNQIPKFNLFRYDGTHAKCVSGLFFYVEDPDFTTDAVLLKRVKTTADSDFIFGIGMVDGEGRHLFYREDNNLKSIWQAGPQVATATTVIKSGTGNGSLTVDNVTDIADNQSWIITAKNPTTFSVVGSRSGALADATVGVPYSCDDLSFTITSGSTPFQGLDKFTFKVNGPMFPRYVIKQGDQLVNFAGGVAADKADNVITGEWLTPGRMFQNIERETRTEISYGDLLSHARSVARNQDGLVGSSLGNNNLRTLSFDAGKGGTIREFGSNFPLLMSMLMQQNISPLTVLDFAEQQYNAALASIDQFMIDELPQFITNLVVAPTNTEIPDNGIIALAARFEELRGTNELLKSVFSDSTAKVKNWPITLPMMGMTAKVEPSIQFDNDLGIDVIVHHDGHLSPLAARDADFDRNIVKTPVLRSDGSRTAGVFSEAAPTNPYMGQLWMKPSTFQLSIFDVVSDGSSTPPDIIGTDVAYWYNRPAGIMMEWNFFIQSWVPSTASISSRWKNFDTATIKNSLVLAIEDKLYDSVHTQQSIVVDLESVGQSAYAELELARYAAKNGYDTYAAAYSAQDAFTWNYSQSPVAPAARWFDVYKNYFESFGVQPTSRPNLEPWKLLGQAVKPANWDYDYASTAVATTNQVNVNYVDTAGISLLFGLLNVDGVAVANGDRVLVVNQSQSQFNGIYVAGSSGWSRSTDVLVNGLTINVSSGATRAGTQWVIESSDPIDVNITDVQISQVRVWKETMWADIKATHPALKLCVNVYNDRLLAPYTSPSVAASSESLLTAVPTGAANGYQFLDNGVTEAVWRKSIEYKYGLARAYFKTSPLSFLDATWGETYLTTGNSLRVERNTMASLPSSKFLLHGERLNVINTFTQSEIADRVSISAAASVPNKIEAIVSHVGNNLTWFDVYIKSEYVGGMSLNTSFSMLGIPDVDLNSLSISDQGIAYELGDTFTIEFDANLNLSVSFTPSQVKKFKGLCQAFTNLLRYNYVDTQLSEPIIHFRKWEVKLAHRLGALIRPDTLSVNTSQGILPSTAFQVLLKKSEHVESKWISAIRVQLIKMGKKTLNDDGLYIPVGDASDWEYRVEVYNPANPTLEYYNLNTTGDFITYYALNKKRTDIAWKKYTSKQALNIEVMPKTVTGLQTVINIIDGYVARLEEMGWYINSDTPTTDQETGRNLNWQLEIEKLIDRTFGGMQLGEGHIMNPFAEKLNLSTPMGLLSAYTKSNFIDAQSMQAAFDVTGAAIPVSELYVIRTDDSASTQSNTPMFSAHVFTDEYEHCILMNQRFSDSDNSATIFDPFLGIRLSSAYLSFIRQSALTRKPTFGGFFLSGSDVKRNLTSSIDTMSNYYDPDKTFFDPQSAEHALALLGFNKKDYFNNISVNDTTQFNFWRGLIQAKGTEMAIDAFVNYKKFIDASTDEYWAYKVAEFGDARERSFPEIKINPRDVTQKFTRLQFYSSADTTYNALPLYTQIENEDDTRWSSIDDLGNGLKFEATYITETVEVASASTVSPAYVRLNSIFHNGDSCAPVVTPSTGIMVSANLLKVTAPGTYVINGFTWNNPTKHSPIKLFDYSDDILINEIGLWHPAIGIHAAAPLEIVNIISNVDPALYSYTTKTSNNIQYKALKPWGKREVGRVFWDTSNLSYLPYYDAKAFESRDSRHARWGAMAEWSSIDLHEWTESDVHPAEYDALAASEEGNSQIDVSVRASGKASFVKNYFRTRNIFTRPIAWSQSVTGNQNAHPAFGPSEFTRVYASGDLLILDKGRATDANMTAGRRFGGWKNNTPYGEVSLLADLEYNIGSSLGISTPVLASGVVVTAVNDGLFGNRIGNINIIKFVSGGTFLRLEDSTGFVEDVSLTDWTTADISVDHTVRYRFEKFGLDVVYTRNVGGTLTATQIADAIVDSSTDLFIREAVRFEQIIALPDDLYVNDQSDPSYVTTDYEWRTWQVPTQADLDADLLYPNNTWKAYVGDLIPVSASAALVKTMKESGSTLTLRSGEVITRFTTTWNDWSLLSAQKFETISNGVSPVSFAKPEVNVDMNRVSIYSNGIQLSPASYSAGLTTVDVSSMILPEGSTVTMLYRAYQPTAEELAFNPDVSDDLSIQTQFKSDYEYSVVETRDASGNITGSKYYFWVTDKTVPAVGKSMSLVQAKNTLKVGPSVYATFSRMLSTGTNSAAFDSCAISGLTSLVSKNDSFKLRFLRNFTLRDDPEEMNLKNVHTEWALIRKKQSSKIPDSLWSILTDAVAGQDAAGNQLPSQTRIDYDARNGTFSRYGFKNGQIFADTALLRASIVNTILNTQLTLQLVNKTIPDTITALNMEESDTWFIDADSSRATMDLIWSTARPSQINEIFFDCLEDALANNYEFSDIFKTSFISVNSISQITLPTQQEQLDDNF